MMSRLEINHFGCVSVIRIGSHLGFFYLFQIMIGI